MPREICVQLMSWTKSEDVEEKEQVKEDDKSDKEE